uniref:F-box domain containing protein n=1 Tax=Colletotrichum fructicola (strain Nara gc5) TaxID=1213859 RepID=L2GJM9_COLFN
MAPALQTTDPTTHQFAQSHPNQHVVPIHDGTYGNHATVVDDDDTDAGEDPSAIMRKLMKGKDKEWDAVTSTKSSGKKLTLLELPITHTNDLTSLALTNSNLHNLAIPHIYSRFDIVWPDATQMNTSDSKSVDALTYGLSTICLGSSFAHRTRKMLEPTYNMASPVPFKRRPKNDYAKYTRKFSLGNGPTDWVAEYMISKESGKMLGTLVALAVEKMVNLEAFVWDMPTGVLSDIFMALASISEHSPDGESKLEKVWSLTVLDIDELAYLDEMAMVIERSKDRLQELRVGISQKAVNKDFAQPWDGPDLHQIDREARWPGESSIGDKRLGGSSNDASVDADDTETLPAQGTNEHVDVDAGPDAAPTEVGSEDQLVDQTTEEAVTYPEQGHGASVEDRPSDEQQNTLVGNEHSYASPRTPRKRLEGKLKLRTLELERVNLSIQVCIQAFDWTVLTNITILDCVQSEHLWKGLRRQFAPAPASRLGSHAANASKQPMEYHLCLKSIHTDTVSSALVSFLRDTLAPNSLEVLFLQDRRRVGPQPATIEQVFKGVIKKHRSSLQKVLLDSSDRKNGNVPADNSRWRNWVLSTDMLLYMTSGRMSNLRELAISLHYKDWHTFLQRLPNVPHLRSLNLQHVAEHIVGNFEPRELALQMVDIITLRPEIQLCYVGISTKCFEILESKPAEESGGSIASVTADHHGVMAHDSGVDDEDDEDDNAGTDEETASQMDEETSEEEDDDDDDTPASAVDADDTQSEVSAAQDSDDESLRDAVFGPSRPRLRLREILFYDDKVAIFKARHGRL